MEFEHIILMNCPQCGCGVVQTETKKDLHTNGHWNEYRTFACGRTLHFSPNFMKVQGEGVCTQSKTYKKAIQKRLEAMKRLKKYINRYLGTDLSLKTEILSAIKRI